MKITNKLISILLAVAMLMSLAPVTVFASEQNTVILYTNDVHCAIDDYPVLAAYKAQLEAEGSTVVLVDAGDAIQGEVIGALTEGEAIVDIMNAVGYDYAVPGNHEFDYGMEVFLDLANNKAEYDYISSNFYYLPSVSPVFTRYAIEDLGDYQIAFVGISTPETITKSTPEYFKNDGGNFIYGFPTFPEGMTNEALYENIQESVDNAIAEGADIVVAVGHTGILETSAGWKSTDIIANTDGIDYYIDAHSHETTESAVCKNTNNEDVVLSSTGTKLANFGALTINGDDADFELINPDEVDVEAMSAQAKSAYNTVKDKVDGYNDEIAYLYEEIGESYANLVAYDEDGSWAVRKRETNAGDFVADAYRAVTDADVAIVNGGGVRAEIAVGDVTRKMLMDMNAFNNDMCVIEVTGQQLIDVLEHGARECPDPIGGFYQVSGVTFEIHAYRETPVICDQLDNFIEMDETKERRVQNVYVGDEPIDLDKTYTLAGSVYVLTQGGDGLTMLEGATVVQKDNLPCDSEMLIQYLEVLGGKITAEMYGIPDGDGRIKIIVTDPDAPEYDYDYEIELDETITVSAPNYNAGEFAYIKFVPETDGRFVLKSNADEDIDPICELYDANMEYLDDNDDEEDLNFHMEYNFTAGEIYYFAVAAYSENAEFDVSLVCGHSYDDGVCTTCGKVCNHEITDANPCACECGEVFNGEDISAGDETEFYAEKFGHYVYFRFIPDVSGVYIFESVSESDSSDPSCNFYNSDFEQLKTSDDVNGSDFFLVFDFKAGETYYFEVFNYIKDEACNLKLSRAVHTADDGSEHELEIDEGIESTCIEHGYTEGLYCSECDIYTWGHEEAELSDWHNDYDGDYICDDCGEEIIYEQCSHICHSDHWFLSFIWTIANFIHSLFGISPVCECGELHYFN